MPTATGAWRIWPKTYGFDLTPIKTLYQEAYREDAGTIVLLLRDASENVSDLVYSFGP